MGKLDRRLRTIAEHVAVVAKQQAQEVPGWERWLRVLQIFLPTLERADPTPEFVAAVERMRRSIALLEEYGASEPHAEPWVYLEYFCSACAADELARLRPRLPRSRIRPTHPRNPGHRATTPDDTRVCKTAVGGATLVRFSAQSRAVFRSRPRPTSTRPDDRHRSLVTCWRGRSQADRLLSAWH